MKDKKARNKLNFLTQVAYILVVNACCILITVYVPVDVL